MAAPVPPIPGSRTAPVRAADNDACAHLRVCGFSDEDDWVTCAECGGTVAPYVERRAVGRPRLFTVEAQERIIDGLANGEMQATAAAAAGIEGATLRLWLESKDPEFKAFQHRVRVARGESRARVERLVAITKPEQWLKNAARNSLAPNEFPDDSWADKREVTGTVRHAHLHAHADVKVRDAEIDYSKLSDEQLAALEAAHEALALPEHVPDVGDGAEVIDVEGDEDVDGD